jgi:activating signal cointegrator 1
MIINIYPKPGEIPAITISQPWARLIANGDKRIENRIWKTDYRGPIAIHAGKGTQWVPRTLISAFMTGGIVALAELIDCVPVGLLEQQLPPDDPQRQFMSGPWCLILRNVQHTDFVEVRGQQGLWAVASELVKISADQSPRPLIEEATQPKPTPAAEPPEPATPAAARQRKLF